LEYYETSRQKSGGCHDFYEVSGGNNSEAFSKTTRQYVCKELILDIASWVSVDFYDKCNKIIIDFYVADFKRNERAKLQEKDDIITRMDRQHAELVQNHNQLVSENPDATIILDLPLVGAQDRMTEVRRRVRQNITDGLLGRSTFRASLVSNLADNLVNPFLRSILDVHEEFESIPLDVIRAARQQLAI
jgi:KilA-N domain